MQIILIGCMIFLTISEYYKDVYVRSFFPLDSTKMGM